MQQWAHELGMLRGSPALVIVVMRVSVSDITMFTTCARPKALKELLDVPEHKTLVFIVVMLSGSWINVPPFWRVSVLID